MSRADDQTATRGGATEVGNVPTPELVGLDAWLVRDRLQHDEFVPPSGSRGSAAQRRERPTRREQPQDERPRQILVSGLRDEVELAGLAPARATAGAGRSVP